MICKYLNNDICQLASDIAEADCTVSQEQCEYCTNTANPSQNVNVVTVSLAIKNTNDKAKVIGAYGQVVVYIEASSNPGTLPGTELRKLVHWFIWDRKVRNCTICKDREERMNRWGADNCEKNIATIVGWLQESAKERGYPFSARVAAALVRRAIANSRR